MINKLLAYSKKQAAAATSLSVRGIDYLIEKGQLRAVKIGRRVLIPSRELERLIEDLRRCAMPYTCPHGRPTLIEMNYRELEKKFGRAQ